MGEKELGLPMKIQLDLDPEMIEKHLVEAIVKSSMGKHIETAVSAFLLKRKGSYGNEEPSALEAAVASLMQEEVKRIIRMALMEKKNDLEQKVKALLTDEAVGEFTSAVWNTLLEKIKGY